MKLDLFDMIALMGLSMMFVGLWWLSPPVALIITGALLVGFGVWGSRAAAGKRASGKAGDRG